jgi:hypothetical protein
VLYEPFLVLEQFLLIDLSNDIAQNGVECC